MKKIIILFALIAVLASSCASFYMKKSGQTAVAVAEALEAGNASSPVEWSTVPFVFDGEILISGSTVAGLWNGLVDSGFKLKNPVITSIEPALSSDYVLFRDSWEMEVVFRSRLPKYTYKARVEGIEGEILLLIYRNEDKGYSIMGLKAEAK